MRRRLRLLPLLLVAFALSGCVESLDGSAAPDPLEGTWQVRALPLEHGCPDLGRLPPVDPGAVTFARVGEGFRVSPRGSGASVEYEADDPSRWTRSVSREMDGCRVEGDSTWTFEHVGRARFTASYRATYRATGRCEVPVDRCGVSYTVVGVR